MAIASFKLLKCLGSGSSNEYDTNKVTGFLSINAIETPANAPVARPQLSGDPPNYSFELWLKLECTAAPENEIDNLKVYGPGVRPDEDGAGKLTINWGTTPTFATPTDSASSVATTRQDTNHYSPGTAMAVGVQPADDVIDAVGEQSDYIVQQLKVEYGAESGNMPSQSFAIQYEET